MEKNKRWMIIVLVILALCCMIVPILKKEFPLDGTERESVDKTEKIEEVEGTEEAEETEGDLPDDTKTTLLADEEEQEDTLEKWRKTIEEWYISVFRNRVIQNTVEFLPYQGKTVTWRAYDIGEGYIRTEVELEAEAKKEVESELGDSSEINRFISVFQEMESSLELCTDNSGVIQNKAKALLLEGTLYIETKEDITFQNFAGKAALLKKFEDRLRLRYFNVSKSDDRPIFHESTRAVKVWIMDFGPLDALRYMVLTGDGYVYEFSQEQPSEGEEIEAVELIWIEAEAWLGDLESGKQTPEKYESYYKRYEGDENAGKYKDEHIEEFSRYYHFFMDHVISCIELDESLLFPGE